MQYWLMKSEPDCYSIDDLQRDGTDVWSGVRNYQARNFMRDMKKGDQVFYYHSSCTPPGIVGLATITAEHYPDPTQFDPEDEYYDPRATQEKPLWSVVDVSYKETFSRMLTLEEIRNDPSLSTMRVAQRGNRLSVVPVSAEHAHRILSLLQNTTR